MFFGTISPSTTCSETTIDSAITKAIGCSSDVGHAERVEQRLEQVRDRGLDDVAEAERADRDAELGARPSSARRAPSRASVIRAAREPSSARGSISLRRAEISANSAPTKNALSPSRSDADQRWRARSLIGSSSVVRSGGGARRRPAARRSRRPSIASTVRVTRSSGSSGSGPSITTVSPTSGIRSRCSWSRPASVSYSSSSGTSSPISVLGLVRAQQRRDEPRAVVLAASDRRRGRRARRAPRRRSPRSGPRA